MIENYTKLIFKYPFNTKKNHVYKERIIKIIYFTAHVYNVIKSKSRLNPIEEFKKDTALESYNYFKKYFARANLFKVSDNTSKDITCSVELFEFAFNRIVKNSLLKNEYLILEFGTFKGETAKVISAILKKSSDNILYTFDSFEGLSTYTGHQNTGDTKS